MGDDNDNECDDEERDEDMDEDMDQESDYGDENQDPHHRNNAKMHGDGMSYQTLNAQHLHNSHLYKRGPTKYQKASNDYFGSNSKGHWTKEEDMALADAVKKN